MTADLAIYSKAKQILWSKPEPLVGKVTMRLGVMHMTMAFIASIGKLFGDGGLQNILTSSDVYATATGNQMLQGKQHTRGIRGIRLAHEALTHMYLTSAEAFAKTSSLPWLSDETKQSIQGLEKCFEGRDLTVCAATCQELKKKIPQSMLDTISLFQKAGRQQSATFVFWDSFLVWQHLTTTSKGRRRGKLCDALRNCDGNSALFDSCRTHQLCSLHSSVYCRDEAVGTNSAKNV